MHYRDSRRHPTRPRRRRPPQRLPLAAHRLVRANALMADGEFAEAAQHFVRLSSGARRRGMPIRAANLAVRASQAYLAQDHVDSALEQIRVALRILIHRGQAERAVRVVGRATGQLKQKRFNTEAKDLRQYADQLLDDAGIPVSASDRPSPLQAGAHQDSLPNRCAGCVAPLVANDVTWHDAQTAECPYCGVIIKAI